MIKEPELPTGAGGVRDAGADTGKPSAAEQLEVSHAANAAVRSPKIVIWPAGARQLRLQADGTD